MDLRFLMIFYLISINIVLFLLMGADKWKAKAHQWRIPEKVLLLLGLFGGGAGGLLGQRVFRHKTRRPLFYVIFIVGLFSLFGIYYFFS